MKRQNIYMTLLTLFLATTLFGRPVDLKGLMLQFDQAYIQMWFMTEQGDQQGAYEAMPRVIYRWDKLERNLHQLLPEGIWQEHLDRTNGWLSDAYFAITDNRLNQAAIALDHARFELMAMRRTIGMKDYILDGLYNLHADLDLLAEVTEDPKLCLLTWHDVGRMVRQVKDDWKEISLWPVEWVFGFYEEEDAEVFPEYYRAIDRALIRLCEAEKDAQQSVLAKTVTKTDVAVLDLIRWFGQVNMATAFQAYPDAERLTPFKSF